MFNRIHYIADVFVKPLLCFIGIMVNTLSLFVLHNKNKKNHMDNVMYKHMSINSLFNLLYCIVHSFALMNVCIYPRTSFCSRLFNDKSSQYFKIWIGLFAGESIRFCCNASYLFFMISRFYTITHNPNAERKLFLKFKNMNLKIFTICMICVGLLLNVYLVMAYKVKFDPSLSDAPFNAYDIVSCGNSLIAIPTFLLRCKIFPILNLINSVLNNIVYLCVSVFIDILLIHFTKTNLKHKIHLTNDVKILNEAIKFKAKINKMIILNGMLYAVSHVPQFVVTVAFFVLQKKLNGFCYFYLQCDDFLELCQTFSLVAISFSFFIYKRFDNNIRASYTETVASFICKFKKQ